MGHGSRSWRKARGSRPAVHGKEKKARAPKDMVPRRRFKVIQSAGGTATHRQFARGLIEGAPQELVVLALLASRALSLSGLLP